MMGPFITEGQARFMMAMFIIGCISVLVVVFVGIPFCLWWLYNHVSIAWQ